jgi:malate dehydrogenase (oxaloacetate-decarboxylating)
MIITRHLTKSFKTTAKSLAQINSRSIMDSKYKAHKHPMFGDLPLSTSGPVDVALDGLALLRNPYFNKGSAFTKQERDDFDLHGLLPVNVQSLKEQVDRAYHQFSTRPDDLAKNTFMSSMRMQNEVLFYKVSQRSHKIGVC